ncbi:MAG: ferredoxin, partial [Eubacteriales bacterium]|nr:ferredoxin [Eubacteriales bacterium]
MRFRGKAPAYDEAAVKASQKAKQHAHSGCPGSRSMSINHEKKVDNTDVSVSSQLSQWPVQIKLVPVNAPYFDGANLLVAADCSAYAYGNFHNDFIKNKITLIGCPKLDDVDYADKLTAII